MVPGNRRRPRGPTEPRQALNPLLVGLKVFADRLDRAPDKPITVFSGKETGAWGQPELDEEIP